MLVLTRHVHQSIVIGHDVIVTVLEVRGDQVRLGITAPKDIQVHREEVFAALTAANRQAATSATELEVLKELSSEPVGSSQAPPRRPDAGAGAPVPRGGPGLGAPASRENRPGPQPTKGPSSGQPSSAPTASPTPGPSTSGSPAASRSKASPGEAAQHDQAK
ncbi:MAG: carbon storage regulator CsrA [Acidimicrobiales bacterium]